MFKCDSVEAGRCSVAFQVKGTISVKAQSDRVMMFSGMMWCLLTPGQWEVAEGVWGHEGRQVGGQGYSRL